jgi:hypothetical protein
MRWERLNILIDRLAHEQDEFGQFILARDGALIGQQEGVFRTNCIDCLDRTNVVQSMLARRSLQYALEVVLLFYSWLNFSDLFLLSALWNLEHGPESGRAASI